MEARLRHYSGKFGFKHDRLTPYCVRRGAASWHFVTYHNYDATQALGRWQQARTAKQYIDAATAEVARSSLPQWGQERLAKVLLALPTLLSSPVRS